MPSGSPGASGSGPKASTDGLQSKPSGSLQRTFKALGAAPRPVAGEIQPDVPPQATASVAHATPPLASPQAAPVNHLQAVQSSGSPVAIQTTGWGQHASPSMQQRSPFLHTPTGYPPPPQPRSAFPRFPGQPIPAQHRGTHAVDIGHGRGSSEDGQPWTPIKCASSAPVLQGFSLLSHAQHGGYRRDATDVGRSEIQPHDDSDMQSARGGLRVHGGSQHGAATPTSTPMSIPGRHMPRTYRVVVSTPPSNDGNPQVLRNTAERSTNDVVQVFVDSGQASDLAAAPVSASLPASRTFLGALFNRPSRGHTPDNSVHGVNLLPHHYRPSPGAEAVLSSASPSLEASSVLGRACGSLRRQGLPSGQKLWAPDGPPTSSGAGAGTSTSLGRGRMRAFASVDNLTALQRAGSDAALVAPRVASPSTGELRYPHIAEHLARQRRTSSGTGNGLGIPSGWGGQRAPSGGLSGPSRSIAAMQRSSSLMALLQYENGDPTMCAADIAVLSSSLPTNFGQPSASMLRRVDSMTSAGSLSRVASSVGGSHENGWGGVSTPRGGAGGSSASALPPAPPICLICLEMLTPQDFVSGEALQLECLCKGELAYRHRACAIEWSNVKGNLLCDICKQPIANLPEIDPAIVAAREAARRRRQPAFAVSPEPTTADYIFDAIRVTWVTIIICILFVDSLSVSKTFLIGASVGLMYIWLSMLLQHMCNRLRERRRAALTARVASAQAVPGNGRAGVAGTGRSGMSASPSDAGSLHQPLLIPGDAV